MPPAMFASLSSLSHFPPRFTLPSLIFIPSSPKLVFSYSLSAPSPPPTLSLFLDISVSIDL